MRIQDFTRPDSIFVTEVIICNKKRRGDGIDDPIRIITEIFTKEGTLIADNDPLIQHPDSAYSFGFKPSPNED